MNTKNMKGLIKMLTFEKVLEVFKEYLEKDTICEVVHTKQGYTVLYWDGKGEEWYSVDYCKTPEDMIDVLLNGYSDYLEQGYTHNRHNLTDDERMKIDNACNALRQKCNS